ncbi:hypothetical protein [Streptomyces halobius]|uniref:Uncharacterized protein n=1 Tax=Streptomyces halobius TaxID=2879846 RepID=A0ABY4M7T1_9ACTN|nr:hypothetical protein [Streptomyces halobius]UQA93743.1 hypothetical protein K9S39_19405 [Streptomyces halobius]
MSGSLRRRRILSKLALGACSILLLGSGGVAAAADSGDGTPAGDYAPSSRPAAGPEALTRANNHRPVSGKDLEAGPTFTKDSAGVWQANRTTVTLRNTVTDADDDAANLTFEVYTTDADGNPKDQVHLTDPDTGQPAAYGVVVSDFVTSGGRASVTLRYGDLKTNTTYAFRTSAYDGGLYETSWSSWAKFHTRGRAVSITLPEPKKDAPAVNQDDHQEPKKIAKPIMTPVDPTEPPTGRSAEDGWNCGKLNKKTGIQPCSRLIPDTSKKTRDALTKEANANLPHLVDWCANYNSDIKRYGACIGGFTYEYVGIVIKDGKPTGETLNASWAVGQEVKLAGNSATFTQQLILVPTAIDPKFGSVTLNVEFDCLLGDRCSNGPQSWNGALEWSGADPFSHTAIGEIDHTWNAVRNADTLDLSTKITAYSPVANPAATRWQANDAQIRCDKISSTTPGCTFYKYIPTWVMNFDKTPPAVAHAWLIQAKLPNHPGSKAAKRPLFYLPAASKNAPGRDPDDNRKVICPDGWAATYGNPDATTVPEISPGDKASCDEFAYASTYNSGGMPAGIGGMNEVDTGNDCVQTYATRVKQGEWHLYDDVREAAPTWTEVCGRSAMSGWINSTSMGGAFSSGFANKYRMLDKDPYWVNFPQFAHCDASKATVACTVPKP